jgi:hypothetical protein
MRASREASDHRVRSVAAEIEALPLDERRRQQQPDAVEIHRAPGSSPGSPSNGPACGASACSVTVTVSNVSAP